MQVTEGGKGEGDLRSPAAGCKPWHNCDCDFNSNSNTLQYEVLNELYQSIGKILLISISYTAELFSCTGWLQENNIGIIF